MPAQRFRTKLLSQGPGGAWTYLELPFDAAAAFGSRARVSVRGTLNGFPFRSSIFPDGKGGHTMMVNKAMQVGAKAAPGQTISVEMEPDTVAPRVAVPADLRHALTRSKAARQTWERLTPRARRDFVAWLDDAKKDETRARRVQQAIERLAQGKRLK
jgi:hypothetical protein